MSRKRPMDFRDPDNLTVSEIDRYADYESESDVFSSGDSYKPNSSESSDEDDLEGVSMVIDNDIENISNSNTLASSSSNPSPGPSNYNVSQSNSPVLPSTSLPVPIKRGKKPQIEFHWNNVPQMKTFIFNQPSGLKISLPGNEPIDYFRVIIDNCFLQSIVKETNLNAVEIFLSSGGFENSRISNWKDLTLSEFNVFLGLLFHTGIVKMPQLQQYWKTDELFKTCFGKYMS